MQSEPSVLDALGAKTKGYLHPDPLEQYELIGAVSTEDNAGIFEALTGLSNIMGGCPFTAAYEMREHGILAHTLKVFPVESNMAWSCIYLWNNMPAWVKTIFYDYMQIFKWITNSDPAMGTCLSVYTKEQVDEWLDAVTALDFTGDMVFTMIDMNVFGPKIAEFASKPYGWKLNEEKLPVFLKISSITNTEMVFTPITTLGSIILQSSFSVPKADIPALVVMGKISVYVSMANPHMQDMLKAFQAFQNKIGESHA